MTNRTRFSLSIAAIALCAACDNQGAGTEVQSDARLDGPSPPVDAPWSADASVPRDAPARADLDQDASPAVDAATDVGVDVGADAASPRQPDASVIPPEGLWSELPALPGGARQETAVVALGERIFVIGGFTGGAQIVGTVEVFDVSTGAWSVAADLPVAVHHANATAIDGRIYVVGFSTGFDFRPDGRGYVYDPAADVWSEGPSMPGGQARGAAVTVANGSDLYLAGGLAGGGAVDLFSVLDTLTGTWRSLTPLPTPRDHGGGAFLDGRLYLVGGRGGGIARHTARVDVYDPAMDTWSAGPAMPTSRGGFALAAIPEGLYVIGGEGNEAAPTGVFDQVEYFDAAGAAWRTLAPMPTPRHGTGAVVLGGRVYVPGGATRQAFGAVDTFEVFTPPTE